MAIDPWLFTELDCKLYDRMTPIARRDFYRRKFMPRLLRYLCECHGYKLYLVERGIGLEMVATLQHKTGAEVTLQLSEIQWRAFGKPMELKIIQNRCEISRLKAETGDQLNKLFAHVAKTTSNLMLIVSDRRDQELTPR